MPKPFNFFAGAIRLITEINDSPESVITMLYFSMTNDDRKEFLQYINTILKSSVDPEQIDNIWSNSGGSIGFRKPIDTVMFLERVLDICQSYQQTLDLEPKAAW